MTFAGINYWAVVVAAVVGWGFGVVWYMALDGRTPLHLGADARPPRQGAGRWPYIISFVADLVMA